MKKRPHLLHQITPHDIVVYREVCYETARKEYNAILDFYERPVRFLTFKDLLTYYDPLHGDAALFWERYEMLSQR
ncbi:MAG: hypothetical protein HWD82_09335 [Flavobacteriaceae bacterium]|mgnify:CR=1 FL=1|jgi:hypothetical protein|uniref:hypothetical protein n=1 Tax=Polaribacter marinivivus TaxID=1524260 RepID=UPI0017F51804|nr:hypothetical protein [Flavobacteriaceae bacterium]